MIERFPAVPLTIANFRTAKPGGSDGIERLFVDAVFVRSRYRSMRQSPDGLFIEAALDMIEGHKDEVLNYWRNQGRSIALSQAELRSLARKFAATLPRTRSVHVLTLARLFENRSDCLSNFALTQGHSEIVAYSEEEWIGLTLNRVLDFVDFVKDTSLHDRLFRLYREFSCDAVIVCAMFGSLADDNSRLVAG